MIYLIYLVKYFYKIYFRIRILLRFDVNLVNNSIIFVFLVILKLVFISIDYLILEKKRKYEYKC